MLWLMCAPSVNADLSIRCVVLTGAWARLFRRRRRQSDEGPRKGPSAARAALVLRDNYRTNIHRIVRSIYGLEVPSIAAVNGAAIGLGCDVACMTDIRIASDQAKFGVTFLEARPDPRRRRSLASAARTIGMSRACELLFTGDVIDAASRPFSGALSAEAVPRRDADGPKPWL